MLTQYTTEFNSKYSKKKHATTISLKATLSKTVIKSHKAISSYNEYVVICMLWTKYIFTANCFQFTFFSNTNAWVYFPAIHANKNLTEIRKFTKWNHKIVNYTWAWSDFQWKSSHHNNTIQFQFLLTELVAHLWGLTIKLIFLFNT